MSGVHLLNQFYPMSIPKGKPRSSWVKIVSKWPMQENKETDNFSLFYEDRKLCGLFNERNIDSL